MAKHRQDLIIFPYRLLVAIAFILLAPSIARAQSVSGSVVDSLSGKGLANAMVTLFRDGKTFKFVRTDDKGQFRIDVEARQGDELQATLIGYDKQRQPVGKDGNVIKLAEKTFQLREVKVEGAPVGQRRDTIVYDLTKFATDRDNNLKDVLKKLPGVNVDKNGEISYNGQAISRFTVEGLDLSKGQYNKLTENIRAKDVKKAEVVEHDQPIKALRNRVFTDNIGMNIVLKDSARDQLAVTLRPYFLTDDPTHVGGDAVGMQIGKKKQAEYTAQYDRTGRDLQNQFSIFYNAWDFASTAELPQWYNVPSLQSPIDEERVRRNTSQAYSVDILTKSKNDAENSVSVSYNRNVLHQHTQNVSQYLLDGESPTETTEDKHTTLRQDAFSMDYTHRINSDTHYGNFVVKGSAKRDDGMEGMSPNGPTSETDGDGQVTSQRVRTPEANISAAITQTYILSGSALQWQSTADYHHSKNKLELYTASADTIDRSMQESLFSNLFHTAHAISLNKQHDKWHSSYNLSLKAENLNVAHANNTLLQVGTSPSWTYKDDFWRVALTPGVTLKRFTHQNATMLLPAASIYINRDYGNRADWNFSVNYNENTDTWERLAIAQRRTDYRTWIDAPDFVSRLRSLSSAFTYNYKRAILQFFSNYRLSYSRNWNQAAMDMVITDGNYHYTWTRHDTHSDNLHGSIDLSKGWRLGRNANGKPITLKANLTANGNYSTGQQYSAGTAIDYKFLSYSLKPELIFSPSWMEIDYEGNFTFNRSKTAEEWMETLADWTQRLTLTSTIGHVDLSLAAVLYHNEIVNSPSVNTLLADASATWRIKKLRFSAALRNIFNKKTYDEMTYSGVGIFTNRYWLRPRELMLNVQFAL